MQTFSLPVRIHTSSGKAVIGACGSFLESDEDHGCIVVHGHTPGDEPVVKANRICIDTGAISNGLLTAVVLDGAAAPMFLRAVGRPGKNG